MPLHILPYIDECFYIYFAYRNRSRCKHDLNLILICIYLKGFENRKVFRSFLSLLGWNPVEQLDWPHRLVPPSLRISPTVAQLVASAWPTPTRLGLHHLHGETESELSSWRRHEEIFPYLYLQRIQPRILMENRMELESTSITSSRIKNPYRRRYFDRIFHQAKLIP
jgi:hypothetical protein